MPHPGEIRTGGRPAPTTLSDAETVPEPATYQIVVNGRPGERLLRPFIDDFLITAGSDGTTVLTGPIDDSSHLMGLLNHLASMRIDVVSFAPHPGTPDADLDT